MDFFFTEDGFQVDGEGSFSYEDLYRWAFKAPDGQLGRSEAFLSELALFFRTSLMEATGLELERENVKITYDNGALEDLCERSPLCPGSQFVTVQWAKKQLGHLEKIYRKEMASFEGSVDLYFNRMNEELDVPSRIYFHLVENPKGESDFAFAATYSTVGDDGLVHHYPLRYALYEYKKDLDGLSQLLGPIGKVSRQSAFIGSIVASGEIFHPINLTLDEAYTYLCESASYEEAGIVCRIPDFWKRRKHNTSVSVSVSLNRKKLDATSILSFRPSMVYEGVELGEEEIRELLMRSEGLASLKGRWVDIDKKRLQDLLDTFSDFRDDIGLADAVALSSGMKKTKIPVKFASSQWLEEAFKTLASSYEVPKELNATLRPYQEDGYRYLMCMKDLNLGLCLADDMGLGKTVQVLCYLLKRKSEGVKRVLLVVPSSLIGNWIGEIGKFSPSIDYTVYHGKDRAVGDSFLTITTYSLAGKDIDNLSIDEWDEVILDEAQNIKNASTRQSKALRSLGRHHGLVLTGTPIENNLVNLWSLMDFSVPGLLGSQNAFTKYSSTLAGDELSRFKKAIRPFILRRLKTDKKIIKDLPDKVENDLYASLTKEQLVLYNKVVDELEGRVEELEDESGRKMLVLPAIMKLKQICNHPDQYNGLDAYSEKESGKFALLREIATSIHENREKVLVFTQFVEIIPHLDSMLEGIFGQKGGVIDGSMSPKKRTETVKAFQKTAMPYLVLSLRAAGVGLNLTAASNVIHFDRWWNPAVENQATDRAFRIGQKKKVMVYRFITKDTIEERIDELIKDKQNLVTSILGDTSTDILSTLSSKEIIEAMRFSGEAGL